jgi:CcmD family protein
MTYQSSGASVTAAPETPEGRDTGFRTVAGGPEIASGSTLLVEAYAFIWLLLFAFIFMSWRRQSRLESKIADLERVLAASRDAAAGRAGTGEP